MAKRFPPWIRRRLPFTDDTRATLAAIADLELHTVCQSASCPNIGECFSRRTATFMLMGGVCTRACAYCDVPGGAPQPLDPTEPDRVAAAAARMGLRHVVCTSVNRDDLPDGGAGHFAATIATLRDRLPEVTVEVLIPDFCGDLAAVRAVAAARPDVFNHNLETVRSQYARVRPAGRYDWALRVLHEVRRVAPDLITKSGLLVGLGESAAEVADAIQDLAAVGTQVLTIGQYLRPSPAHAPVAEFIPPAQFSEYRRMALEAGFRHVAAGPFVRSSFNAAAVLHRVRHPAPSGVTPQG